jgi:hypothetical protein
MKFRTVLATAVGVGVGYVLGTRAGRARFDELKAQAQRIVTDPEVRQKVADLPNQVRENLPKAQAAVSDAIKTATDKVQSATSDSPSGAQPSTPPPTTAPPTVPTDPGDPTAPRPGTLS